MIAQASTKSIASPPRVVVSVGRQTVVVALNHTCGLARARIGMWDVVRCAALHVGPTVPLNHPT